MGLVGCEMVWIGLDDGVLFGDEGGVGNGAGEKWIWI